MTEPFPLPPRWTWATEQFKFGIVAELDGKHYVEAPRRNGQYGIARITLDGSTGYVAIQAAEIAERMDWWTSQNNPKEPIQ